jgi:hypothetical protein
VCRLCINHATTSAAVHSALLLQIDGVDGIAQPYAAEMTGVSLVWRAPSGRRVQQDAYFDASSQPDWRARFAPDEPGLWTVRAWARSGVRLLRAGPVLRVQVAAATERGGYIRVSRRNPAMLEYSDDAPYVPIGANVAWYRDDAIAEYARRFEALARNGGNAARVWLAPWSFAVEWRETPLSDYTNRQQRLAQFDAVLALAERHGIKLIVVLLEPGMFNSTERWPDNPYNAANGGPCATPRDFLTDPRAKAAYRDQLRYIAARWGASPSILAWEWFNEVNNTIGFETDVLLPWLREMIPVLRSADLNRHPHTISYGTIAGDPAIWALPDIDIVQRHEYAQGDPKWFAPTRDASGAVVRFKQVREQPLKPVLVGEFGANSDGERPEGAYRQGIHLHNSLWAAPFAGFAGGAMYWWWDNYIEAGDLWPRYRGLARFLDGEDLRAFEPVSATANAALTTRATAMALGSRVVTGGQRARFLLWVRNRAWSHDDALVRYILDKSSGATTAATFQFVPAPAKEVVVMLDAPAGSRCTWRAYDTETGAATGLMGESAGQPTSGARYTIALGTVARDLALKITC